MVGYLFRHKNKSSDKQTIGELFMLNEKTCEVSIFKTLELPWKNNKPFESCIPTGKYKVEKKYSPKFGPDTFTVLNVNARSSIRIHAGNFYTDIEGCLLVGYGFRDINKDGIIDVTKSRHALDDLKKLCDEFTLQIYDI